VQTPSRLPFPLINTIRAARRSEEPESLNAIRSARIAGQAPIEHSLLPVTAQRPLSALKPTAASAIVHEANNLDCLLLLRRRKHNFCLTGASVEQLHVPPKGGGLAESVGRHHMSASLPVTGGAMGTSPNAPGANSLDTALSSGGVGNAQKCPLLGPNAAIDREEAMVDKSIRLICRGADLSNPPGYRKRSRTSEADPSSKESRDAADVTARDAAAACDYAILVPHENRSSRE